MVTARSSASLTTRARDEGREGRPGSAYSLRMHRDQVLPQIHCRGSQQGLISH